jgi:hypothetical protein
MHFPRDLPAAQEKSVQKNNFFYKTLSWLGIASLRHPALISSEPDSFQDGV